MSSVFTGAPDGRTVCACYSPRPAIYYVCIAGLFTTTAQCIQIRVVLSVVDLLLCFHTRCDSHIFDTILELVQHILGN